MAIELRCRFSARCSTSTRADRVIARSAWAAPVGSSLGRTTFLPAEQLFLQVGQAGLAAGQVGQGVVVGVGGTESHGFNPCRVCLSAPGSAAGCRRCSAQSASSCRRPGRPAGTAIMRAASSSRLTPETLVRCFSRLVAMLLETVGGRFGALHLGADFARSGWRSRRSAGRRRTWPGRAGPAWPAALPASRAGRGWRPRCSVSPGCGMPLSVSDQPVSGGGGRAVFDRLARRVGVDGGTGVGARVGARAGEGQRDGRRESGRCARCRPCTVRVPVLVVPALAATGLAMARPARRGKGSGNASRPRC